MSSTTRVTRRLGAALALVFAAGLVGSACTQPTYPWLAAGCIDSTTPGVPDFEFNGIENTANNGIGFEVSPGVFSEDGTCTGTESTPGTIVRAASAAAASTICGDLGSPAANPAKLVDFGYAAPADAYTCISVWTTSRAGAVNSSGRTPLSRSVTHTTKQNSVIALTVGSEGSTN